MAADRAGRAEPMRAIKALFGLALGFGLGAVASYALLRWLSAQPRSGRIGSGAPAGDSAVIRS